MMNIGDYFISRDFLYWHAKLRGTGRKTVGRTSTYCTSREYTLTSYFPHSTA